MTTAKCANYAEVATSDGSGPGVMCSRVVGHPGLCSGMVEGWEHSTGRRRETNFKVQWKAIFKKKVATSDSSKGGSNVSG